MILLPYQIFIVYLQKIYDEDFKSKSMALV